MGLKQARNGRGRRGCVTLGLIGLLAWVGPAWGQQVQQRIADDIVRIYESAAAQSQALPSMALEGNWPSLGAPPGGFPISVNFSFVNNRRIAVIPLPAGVSLYGTGMVSGPLLRNGRFITCWNDDSYGYGDSDTQLYQSHPWVVAVRADGSAFGVIADTTYRCDVDLTQPVSTGIRFSADGPPYPIIAIDRDSPEEVLSALAELTGTMPMPPKWALGYQQCRFSYWNENYARALANDFRNKSIPCDAIWFDIDYMNGYRVFTFNPSNFPNPTQLNTDLQNQGFHTVWMINPGVKWETGYWVNDQGWIGEHWVRWSDGVTNFTGNVWPGTSLFPDFTRSATRNWWAGLYGPFMATGVDGVWNDMNEPALLNSNPNTMPESNVHRGDPEFGGTLTHARYHNVYGMLMTRATREGMQQANPDKRPFVLTRANYLGGHRYAATWTGDNTASWHHLNLSVSMVLTLGLSGQPFSGPDIGGFIGFGDAQLYARWMGVGAMLPFARGHYEGGSPKEPWSFGTATENTCRRAIERRYRLMPYLYTLFYGAHTAGLPVMRPVFFADPTDLDLRDEDDAFLLGSDLLVDADLIPDRSYQPDLPAGLWPRFDFGDSFDADLPQLRLRGGSIVPTGPVMQYVDQVPLNPLTLLIALDAQGQATGQLYEDAGDGYGFQSGDYLLTTYQATRVGDQVTVSIAGTQGNRARPGRSLNVRLITADLQEITAAGTDGTPLTFTVPAPPLWVVDGLAVPAETSPANAVVTQNNATGFGDNLSELDQMFVRGEMTGLRIGITGNLEANTNALALFLDTQPGGQNVLATAAAPTPPQGVAELNGLAFDTGFEPDHLLFINANSGTIYVDQFALPTGGPVSKTYRGSSTIGGGSGTLNGGTNPNGMQIALDNRNTAGITDSSAANAATATSGFEMVLPYTDLGLAGPPAGPIKLVAFVTAANGFVSNQWLPGLGGGQGNLGSGRNLGAIPGEQFATVSLPYFGDYDADGDVDSDDADVFAGCLTGPALPHPGGTDCDRSDIDGDLDVDLDDFGRFQRCLAGVGVLADPLCLQP